MNNDQADGTSAGTTNRHSGEEGDGPDLFQLSFAQERLWFLDRLEPESSLYNIPSAWRVKGPLDVAALGQSLSEIVSRHESLRTTFSAVEERPVQRVGPRYAVGLPVEDLSGLAPEEREAEALRLLRAKGRRPFDLAKGPLLRAALLRLGPEEHVLALTTHRIVADDWSVGVLLRELTALYGAFLDGRPSPLPELPLQYVDYAEWQRERLQQDALEEQLAYWKRQLAFAPALELPSDRRRPGAPSFNGAAYQSRIPAGLYAELQALARSESATLFMTLLAAFKVLLYGYTGQEDLTIGTPVAGRTHAETERLIGPCANTLALRTNLSGDPTFRELLARVRETALGAYEHGEVPFEKLVEELQPERVAGTHPLFQVMFALRSAPPAGLTMAGLTLDTFEADMNAAGFPLTLQLEERDGRLDVRWEYRTDLFEDVTIRRMADNFVTLLMSIPTDPRRRISELYLLSPDERRLVLQSFNDTRRDYGPARCLHEMFEEQSARTPEATAVVHENVRLTYGELNERANRLARRLLSLGVGPERLVGVCMRRTPELIVALLGVLKAGGAYVPLDPEWPRRRAEFVLEDAGVVVVLTQESLLGALPDGRHAILCVDAEAEAVARQDGANPAGGAAPDNLAYVIYTSGSTGRPKGVAVPHRAVFNLLRWAGETFTGGELAGVLASSPVSLDLAVFELFAPLACGGAVVLAEDLTALPELAAAGEVTLVNAVPSAVGEMLRRGGMPASVRAVNLAGEQPGRELVEIIFARTNAEQVRILYGPTEGTAYSTCDTITRGAEGDPAVGRPVANTEAYILDRSVRPAPLGAAGELYLGGSGLARGYVRRPSLTAARFVPDPYSGEPGARLYRTGDVARYLPDGRIEFLGRPEGQVKLRGFRVETGEIESALVAHPGVRDAVVVARDGAGGEKSLVAYVVFEADAGGDIARLRETLGESLPDFMIPSQFVALDELPLDVNGKVDRAVLPEPTAAAPERPYVPPADDLERGLASISSEVLGAERVGRYDNFFDLGGHSLLATRLVSRVREAFGVDVRLREVFDRPTLAEMASTVRSLLHAAESPDATPPPTDEEA